MKRQIKSSECLNGQTVNFSVDRWSNVRNKAMLCAVVTTKNVENYLVDTNDTQYDYTSDNSYTEEYLKDVPKNSIINCEKKFTCTVKSLVADNIFSVKVCTLNFKRIQVLV